MRHRRLTACFAAFLLTASPALAQEPRPGSATPVTAVSPTADNGVTWLHPSQVPIAGAEPAAPFRSISRDFGRFFTSPESQQLLAAFGAAALVSYSWDSASTEEAREHLHASSFTAGNLAGGAVVQGGLAAGTWALGKLSRSPTLTAVGADLIDAQLVTQTVVLGLKYSVQRTRPDGSNNLSFPSGHTASTVATATVLQRHFGWKVGAPAYAIAAYVGAARLAADKHHVSDVLMGAGIGLVAARSVTVGVGGQRFDVGVAPTAGRGAVVTFTRK